MNTPRVFVSYSHDSEDHSLQVLELCNQLRRDGVEAIVNRYVDFPEKGWPRWTIEEIDAADFPGRNSHYFPSPPTVPDVTNSVIRFFGKRSFNTTPTHNFAPRKRFIHCVLSWVAARAYSPTTSRTCPNPLPSCGFCGSARISSRAGRNEAPPPWPACCSELRSIENGP